VDKRELTGVSVAVIVVVLVAGSFIWGGIRNSEPVPTAVQTSGPLTLMTITKITPAVMTESGSTPITIYLTADTKLPYTAVHQVNRYFDPVFGEETGGNPVYPKIGETVTIRRYAVFPYAGITGPEYSTRFVGFAVTGIVGGRQISSFYSVSPDIE
jgi:hypothetical protein